jgi:hypothetical protein
MEGNFMAEIKMILQNENSLRCPRCGQKVDHTVAIQSSAREGELCFMPEPGQVTECEHCLTMLEYGGICDALTLRVAPRERVEQFHKLTREGFSETGIPELLEYVRRFLQPPKP